MRKQGEDEVRGSSTAFGASVGRGHGKEDKSRTFFRRKEDLGHFLVEDYYPWKELYVWNFHLMKDFFPLVSEKKWMCPLVYGYIR